MDEKSTESDTTHQTGKCLFEVMMQNDMCSVVKQNNEITYCKAITTKGSLRVNSSNCSVHKNQHSNQCIVCFENTNIPFKLKCKHTVCDVCIIKWGEKCENQNEKLSCPMCRRDCSDEWSVYTKDKLKYKLKLTNFEEVIATYLAHARMKYVENNNGLCNVEMLRAFDDYLKLNEKMFVFILNKPAYLASRPQFYDLFRIRIIDFFEKNFPCNPNYTKVGKMFKAFNEKYYDCDKETLKTL